MYVEGDLSVSTYQDKESGVPKTGVNIVQRSINVLKRGASHESADEAATEEPLTAAQGRR